MLFPQSSFWTPCLHSLCRVPLQRGGIIAPIYFPIICFSTVVQLKINCFFTAWTSDVSLSLSLSLLDFSWKSPLNIFYPTGVVISKYRPKINLFCACIKFANIWRTYILPNSIKNLDKFLLLALIIILLSSLAFALLSPNYGIKLNFID